jgi:hypothetical protein
MGAHGSKHGRKNATLPKEVSTGQIDAFDAGFRFWKLPEGALG